MSWVLKFFLGREYPTSKSSSRRVGGLMIQAGRSSCNVCASAVVPTTAAEIRRGGRSEPSTSPKLPPLLQTVCSWRPSPPPMVGGLVQPDHPPSNSSFDPGLKLSQYAAGNIFSSKTAFDLPPLPPPSFTKPSQPPACMLQHACNKQSEVRLASVTPSTLNPTCQLPAMTYYCAPCPASRGGRAIALILLSGALSSAIQL